MPKIILIVVTLSFTASCFAECWKIGELAGYSARASDGYEISKDGLTGKTFLVQIVGDSSAVVPNDLSCNEVSSTYLVCISTGKTKAVVETWTVDPKNGTAFHTKSISGYTVFDGANLFIGKILGPCN